MTVGEITAVIKLKDELTPQLAKAEGQVTAFGATVVTVSQTTTAAMAAIEKANRDAERAAAAMTRAVAQFDGSRVFKEAELMARSIANVGGASALTEKELAKANATITEAVAKYRAMGQEVPPHLLALEGATRKMGAATDVASQQTKSFAQTLGGDLKTQFAATMAGFVSAQAIIGAVSGAWRAFTGFIAGSVESYMAAESAQRKLTAALTAAGQAAPATIKQYNALAATFQRTTVYSDDLINEMQALLTQVGGVMPNEMEGALKAATNLASGLGIDLRQATMLVGKAFEGETGTLKRYGIVIDEAKLKAEGLPAVLEAINSKFGGQAAADMDTTAGKLKQLANEWDNVKEAVGGAIINDPLVRGFLEMVVESATRSADALNDQTQALTDLEREQLEAAAAIKTFHFENDDFFTQALLTYIPALGTMRRKVDELRQSYKDAQDEADALKKAIAAIPTPKSVVPPPPPVPPIPPGTIESFIKLEKAQKEAAAAAKKHAEEVEKLTAALGGRGLVGDLTKLEEAIKKLTVAEKAQIDVIIRVIDGYAKVLPKLAPIPAVLVEMVGAWERTFTVLDKIPGRLLPIEKGFDGIEDTLPRVGTALDAFGYQAGTALGLEVNKGTLSIGELVASAQNLGLELPPAKNELLLLGQAAETAGAEFGQFESTFGRIASAVGSTFGSIGKDGKLMANDLVAAFSGAAQVVAQFAGTSQIAELALGGLQGATAAVGVTAMVMGAKFSMAMGLASAGIGLAVGVAISFIQQAQRAAAESARIHAQAKQQIGEMQDTLVSLYGSLEELDRLGKIVGVDLAAAFRQGAHGELISLGSTPADVEEIARLSREFAKELKTLMESVEANAGLASAQLLKLMAEMGNTAETAHIATEFIKANATAAAVGVSQLLAGLAGSDAAKQRKAIDERAAATKMAGEAEIGAAQHKVDEISQIEKSLTDELKRLRKEEQTDANKAQQAKIQNDLEALGERKAIYQEDVDNQKQALADKLDAFKADSEGVIGVFMQTETQARGLAGAIVGAFGEMLAQGVPFRDALAAVQPAIDTMKAQLEATGFSGGAAFASLAEMSRIAGDAIMGPAVDAISGARAALTGLHNSGILNQEMFAGIAMSATQAYDAIVAQGGDGTAALMMMQPTLQTLWKLQQDFGYEVDEGTQKLLDQAEAAGIVGAERLSDAEKQTAAQEKLVEQMGQLLEFFQRLIPIGDAAGSSVAQSFTVAGAAVARTGTLVQTAGQQFAAAKLDDVLADGEEAAGDFEGATDDVKQALFDAGQIGVEAWANVGQEAGTAESRLALLKGATDTLYTTFDGYDFSESIRKITSDAEDARDAVSHIYDDVPTAPATLPMSGFSAPALAQAAAPRASGGDLRVPVYLDGRQIAEAVYADLPSVLQARGVL